ncbi:MAG: hypothetical protein RIS64_2885 [Bacteroidota bacterium]
MTINYIYNTQGQIEYAILPLELWTAIQTYLPMDLASQLKKTAPKPIFEPKNYFGLLAPLNLDVETELKQMRQEWNKSF